MLRLPIEPLPQAGEDLFIGIPLVDRQCSTECTQHSRFRFLIFLCYLKIIATAAAAAATQCRRQSKRSEEH